MTHDVASGRYVGKEAPNLLLEEELEKSDSEGRIRAKRQAHILSYISLSQSVHPHTEIDMAVFEVPL